MEKIAEKFKNIKAVALDLDDTTLRSDSTLADETYAALLDTARAGIAVIVASGRAYTSLPKKILDIDGVRYAISGNGSAVTEVASGKRILSRTLPAETVHEILNTFPDATLECFLDSRPYSSPEYMADPMSFGCPAAYVGYVRTTREPVADIRGFIRENADKIDSIDIVCPTPEIKARTYEKARAMKNVYVTSSSPRLVEFASTEAGKGKSLRRLCERLGIQAENVAAFGNGDNDADMLQFAGLGVAVENGTEYCRQSADYICETNDELGVARTLRRILSARGE